MGRREGVLNKGVTEEQIREEDRSLQEEKEAELQLANAIGRQ